MTLVYRNSTCTITAAGASNPHHRYFSRRNPLPLNPCIITGLFDDDMAASIFNSGITDWRVQPLFRRGWVLVEQMLSPHTLNFSSKSPWWS